MTTLGPGSRLGPYEVRELVGSGGMGAIYRGFDAALHRDVALKVLSSELLRDPAFGARFRREAQIWARLDHPAIVPVYFAGIEEEQPFVAVKLVVGGTLADRLRQGALTFEAAAAILGQVASALDHAHDLGVVHRDVKPTNVLLDEEGRAYLTDFGLARVVAGAGRATEPGNVVGTPAYMAPEQARGEEPGPRADIYSLGCMTYEMLTGSTPFLGLSAVDLLLRHIGDAPTPPRSLAPHLAPHVESAILRAMAKDPDHRWPRATLLVQALRGEVDVGAVATIEHAAAAPAIPSRPAAEPAAARTAPRSRRRDLARAAALGLVLGLGLLLGIVAWRARLLAPAPSATEQASARLLLEATRRALDEGAYPEALELAQLAARLHPHDASALGLRESVRRAWEAEKELGLWPSPSPPARAQP